MRPLVWFVALWMVTGCAAAPEEGDGPAGAQAPGSPGDPGQLLPPPNPGEGGSDAGTDPGDPPPPPPTGPAIERVSGNGQLTIDFFAAIDPLVVEVTHDGEPSAGTTVSWEILAGEGGLSHLESETDAEGLASVTFIGGYIQPGISWVQQNVRASIEGAHVDFLLTTANKGTGAPVYPHVQLLAPTDVNRDLGSAPQGTTLPAAVEVIVVAQNGIDQGQPIPDVALNLRKHGAVDELGAATCAGGELLTGPDGHASCDLQVSGPVGQHKLAAVVGSFLYFDHIDLEITP